MKLYYNQVANTILDVKVDKRNECFNFGKDNAYPSLIEALIRMSVTAQTCTDRVTKAIYGASFGDDGNVIVNSKDESLNEVFGIGARWYAKQNNCYLHISYDANLDIKAIVVVPVTDSRTGKADDKGYSGKYIIYDNWDKSKKKQIKKAEFELYDRYNPDKKIIEKQIRAASKDKVNKDTKIEDIISDYKGQILHIQKDKTFIYSLSDLNPVLSEALLESNSQTFRSNGAEDGFLNVKILTVPPFKDEKMRTEFKKDLKGVRGAKNSSSVVLLEASQATEDISKQMHLDDLSGEYNDKLFEYSDSRAEKNICKAFTVPLILVSPTDGSLFGNSGALLKEAKIQLWETREEDRDKFEEVFSKIMKLFPEGKRIEEGVEVVNPYAEEEEEIENKNINKQAQATLRGTAAGVQGVIGLATAVKEDKIEKEEAVEIIKNIYGFTKKQAKAMIGGFIEEEEENKV